MYRLCIQLYSFFFTLFIFSVCIISAFNRLRNERQTRDIKQVIIMKVYQQLLCTTLSLFVSLAIILITLFALSVLDFSQLSKEEHLIRIKRYETQLEKKGFTNKQIQDMSLLGKWLLAPEGSPLPINVNGNRTFLILFWQWIPKVTKQNITWKHCSVQNCILSDKREDVDFADAVAVYLHMPWRIPAARRPDQRWIFLSDKNPKRNVLNPYLSKFNGMYNWSMTYRTDSDIPIPYGRTVERRRPAIQTFRKRWSSELNATKTKLVAIWENDCLSCGQKRRMMYILKLKSLLGDKMHMSGRCVSNNSTFCPIEDPHCRTLNAFKFYLAFDQCGCYEYLSNDLFLNAYQRYAVPIIMGPSQEECRRLLPPNSFLHVRDFKSVETLVVFLEKLDHDDEHYMRYHEWRDHYMVVNENSISDYYCRICEALNYNPTTPKVYDNIESFWSRGHCL